MVNRVILIGNLGRDPEVRRLENGAVVAKFPIATNDNYKDKSGEWQTQTEWHDVVVWRNLAERAEATLKKGTPVYVEGKLTHRTWQDQDGNNRKTTEVVANYFRALSSGRKEGGSDGVGTYFPSEEYEPESRSFSELSSVPSQSEAPPAGDAEDDLPF
ncbi:MAG TPA: single-stranded DNA-binding protein [Saprospiraceae bacterium]|nr:single-stranded DNA-binding protein [Saprospiraceae bacterium]HMQ81540.1 single-stranded DNA-binding protein [Saprospiraceae bacterium]